MPIGGSHGRLWDATPTKRPDRPVDARTCFLWSSGHRMSTAAQLIALHNGDWTVPCAITQWGSPSRHVSYTCAPLAASTSCPPPRFTTATRHGGHARARVFSTLTWDVVPAGGAPRLPSPHAEDHELSSSWRKMCHADRATPGGGAPVYTSVGARSSAEGKSKGDNARQTAALPAPAWAAELTKPRGGSKPRAGALSAVEAPAPPRNSEPIASFPSAVRLPSPPPRERERIAIAVAGGRKRKANVPTSPTRPNGSAGRVVSRPPRGRAYK